MTNANSLLDMLITIIFPLTNANSTFLMQVASVTRVTCIDLAAASSIRRGLTKVGVFLRKLYYSYIAFTSIFIVANAN